MQTETTQLEITPDMMVEDLVNAYPELMEPLKRDYGFYCVNCLLSGLETLEEGAKMHGVEGPELDDMIKYLKQLISKQT